MGPQEEAEKRFREKPKIFILTGPRDGGYGVQEGHAGPHANTPQWSGGRRQEPGDHLGLGLYWGFCGKGRVV